MPHDVTTLLIQKLEATGGDATAAFQAEIATATANQAAAQADVTTSLYVDLNEEFPDA